MATLQVRDLAFGYGRRAVGRGVSFDLSGGEVLCLLGPNGSGKTTMFRTLLGLIAKQGGEIVLGGESTSGWSRARLAQAMAYVPQAHVAYFPFTVEELVLMGRTARMSAFAVPGDDDREIVWRTLASLGITHLGTRVYTELSGGERQLTLIARALAQAPQVLVMDEPTASLDFGNAVKVFERIRSLASRGMGIVLATHNPDHAFLCADRVALLADGHLLAVGRPEETVTSQHLRRLYGVDVAIVTLPGSGRRVCVPSLGGAAPA
jgi:iron complex transport system ATP-binding protein